jgi:hypothetical protein
MCKTLWTLVLGIALAAPTGVEAAGSTFAIGYSPAIYLETGGGHTPFGISISGSTAAQGRGVEADLAYHRDEGLNTITAAMGPRLAWGGGRSIPYMHMLFLLRHDSISNASNTSGGGMMGFGVDAGIAEFMRMRVGVDLQVVFNSGVLKVVRVTMGAAF